MPKAMQFQLNGKEPSKTLPVLFLKVFFILLALVCQLASNYVTAMTPLWGACDGL